MSFLNSIYSRKIIAVSDMYLSANILDKILKKTDLIIYKKYMYLTNIKQENMTENFIKKLIGTFGEYIKYINIVDINSIFELTINNSKKNYKEKETFNSIIYNDTAVRHKQIPLSKKCLK